MFLTGIKRKSAEKYIAKELQNPKVFCSDKIKTIGVLVDATVFPSFPFLNALAKVFQIDSKDITLLYYLPNKKQAKLFEGPVYSDADLGFRGSVKSEEVSDFVATKFDALINFYDEDKLMLNLISVLSVSRFKIGFSSINIKINDFSVATSVNDIAGFTTELKKYLILLNKI